MSAAGAGRGEGVATAVTIQARGPRIVKNQRECPRNSVPRERDGDLHRFRVGPMIQKERGVWFRAEREACGGEKMTARERILAALRGEETDRFPVWLKMANDTWRTSQPEPYRSADALALLREAGCDVMLHVGVKMHTDAPHVRRSAEKLDGTRTTAVKTPDGSLAGEERRDPQTLSWHPTRFMVETPEDFRRLRWLFTETGYTADSESASRAAQRQKELEAEDVVTTSGVGPGPLMNLVQHISGPVTTVYLMHDEPALFRETLELMHADRMRYLRATLPHEPADTFWLTENTSTTLISPGMFEEFCVPYLAEYGELIREHGLIPVHHMCGALNALLEMIDALPAAANEAFTTRPLGDVSLAEGRRRMPSKALIGGTNATLWLKPAETIVETVARDLAECPDRRRIFLTSAGVLPPPVPFEKAGKVVEGFREL